MSKTFSPKYNQRLKSAQWRQYCAVQHQIWCGRDALIPLLPSDDIDHITYGNLGNEWFLRDTLPLNKVMHRQIITPLRSLSKIGRHKVTTAQRAMTWAMRIWALLMLPVIWVVALAVVVIRAIAKIL